MYVILVYDMEQEKVTKMLKLCRRYLNWIQNSVFEGEITEVKLKELIIEAKAFMNTRKDSIIIFSSRDEKWLDKQVIGLEKNDLDNLL
ncbi:CRISPR-associated endonuclease Cas2 [Chitinophaga solisilvae]|uniref:CRISPR-associated endonuclease Cas2 n=1 Tax=Chitinophaga solisilvae TaxID=1233460 RepID=UPI001369B044|nr:CRISPR-associated endonuclease Cas2 [Chitinophaga solisilvae]